MFRKICHSTINSLPNSKKDYTFTYREYCIMLKVQLINKTYNIFDAFQTELSMSNLIEFFTTILPSIKNDGCANLDREAK